MNVLSQTIAYLGSYVWLILTAAVVLYALIRSDRSVRAKAVICLAAGLLVIFNEISYRILCNFVDGASYYRFLWILPYVLVVTWGLTRLILDLTGRGKWYLGALAAAATIGLVCLGSGTLFTAYPNASVENKYLVSDEVLTIKYLMDQERASGNAGEELRIAYPRLVAIEYVTVDGLASSPTSRNTYYFGFDTDRKDLIDDTDYLIATICENDAQPDLLEAKKALIAEQLDYMVVHKTSDMEDYMTRLGCSLIGETSSYLVYRVDGNCYEPVTGETEAASVMERTGLTIRDIYISLSGQNADETSTRLGDYLVLNDAHTSYNPFSADVSEEWTATADGRYDWACTSTGMHAEDVWQNVSALIDYLQVDGVLMAGDMMDYASHDNYELFAYGLNKFTTPYMYLRADHDRGVWYNADGSFTAEDAGELQSDLGEDGAVMVWEQETYIILGWNDNTGNISEEGLQTAREAFAAAQKEGKAIILVCHVPIESLVDDGLTQASRDFDEQGRVRLWGRDGMYAATQQSQELLDMITAEDSPVVAVIAAHLHFAYTTQLTDRITEYVLAPMFQGSITRMHVCE